MPRPDSTLARRRELAPALARTFADLGYRRTTTAGLARACGVQETILYRLWTDKRAMFVAALDYVYQLSEQTWTGLLEDAGERPGPAELILEYESSHHGEFGLYRIVFAGLSETDDAEIKEALRRLYGRFQDFIREQVQAHRGRRPSRDALDPELSAWALLGLGIVSEVGRELGLLSPSVRRRLFREAGRQLLEGS